MKSKLIITLSIALLVWLTPASARTYRWVDENGVTIYSQSRPPSGTDATVIKTPPPAPASEPNETMKKLKTRLNAIEESKKKENETKEKEDKAAKNAEIRKQNCEAAKKNLEALEQHARVRMKMDDGEYKQLTDEERTAQIEKAKEAIKKNCE